MKNSILSAFAFFLTLIVLSVGYAWTNFSPVGSGDPLSATTWNNLVGNVNDLSGSLLSTVGDVSNLSGSLASRFGTITTGKWCTGSGSGINCTSDAPGWTSQWTTSGSTINYNAGNVGIGTASPGYKLDISDNTANGRVINAIQSSPTGTNYAIIGATTGAATTNIWGYFSAINATTNRSLYVESAPAGANNWSIYENGLAQNYFAGNVGIGTASPTGKLEVSGTTDALRLSGTSGQQLRFMTNSVDATARSFVFATNQSAMGDFVLRQSTTNIGDPISQVTTRFSITPSGDVLLNQGSGNVGIGTTAPNKLLHLKTTTGTNAELDIQSGTKPLWGMYHDETSEELRFWNGSNRVVFGSGGNVGIGTTSPVQKLDVSGNIIIPVNNALYLQSGTDYSVRSDGSNEIFRAGGWDRMFIQGSTGNVGIGTTNPLTKMVVMTGVGGDPVNSGFTPSAGTNLSVGQELYMGTNGIAGGWIQVSDVNNMAIHYPLRLQELGGNVGIGTASPQGLAHFVKTNAGASATQLVLQNNSINDGTASSLEFVSYNSYVPTAAITNTKNDNGGNYTLSLGTYGSMTALNIKSGNVGIGTATPSTKLEVSWGSVNIPYRASYTDGYKLGVGNYNGYIFRNYTVPYHDTMYISTNWTLTDAGVSSITNAGAMTTVLGIGANNGAGGFSFKTGGGAGGTPATRVSMLDNGNVLIGTTSDAGYKLDVNGGVRGISWTNSDRNLKKNIETLSDGLGTILSIRGVRYEWKDSSKGTGPQVGVIAQEVEEVLPELVNTDKQGMKAVNYAGLVAPLIEAVKELSHKINNLTNRLDDLFAKYLDQQKEINGLKYLICLDHPSAEMCR